jgi:hypothetical protein
MERINTSLRLLRMSISTQLHRRVLDSPQLELSAFNQTRAEELFNKMNTK